LNNSKILNNFIILFILKRGDYPAALKMFEKGITQSDNDKDHNEQCACGIARSSLKTGDIRR
jgi:WD repeat-containing protein 19